MFKRIGLKKKVIVEQRTNNNENIVGFINERVGMINKYLRQDAYDVDTAQMKKKKTHFVLQSANFEAAKLSFDINNRLITVEKMLIDVTQNETEEEKREHQQTLDDIEVAKQSVLVYETEMHDIQRENIHQQKSVENNYTNARQEIITTFENAQEERKKIIEQAKQVVNQQPSIDSSKPSLAFANKERSTANLFGNDDEIGKGLSQKIIVGENNSSNKRDEILAQNISKQQSIIANIPVSIVASDNLVEQKLQDKKKKLLDNNTKFGFALVSSEVKSPMKIVNGAVEQKATNQENQLAVVKMGESMSEQIGKKISNYVAIIDDVKPNDRILAVVKRVVKSDFARALRTPQGFWRFLMRIISFPIQQCAIVLSLLLRIRVFFYLIWLLVSIEFVRTWIKLYCAYFVRPTPQIISSFETILARLNVDKQQKGEIKKSFLQQILKPIYNWNSFSHAFNVWSKKAVTPVAITRKRDFGPLAIVIGVLKVISRGTSTTCASISRLFIL